MTFLEQFDHKCFPYASQKTCSYARNGMVATSTQLGSQAGLDILKKGGNAVDAAIATMITNTVVEPTMNNLGSDNFAIVWMNNKMYGLNSSGPAAKNLSIEKVKICRRRCSSNTTDYYRLAMELQYFHAQFRRS
mgnify:CR=1 FL=1